MYFWKFWFNKNNKTATENKRTFLNRALMMGLMFVPMAAMAEEVPGFVDGWVSINAPKSSKVEIPGFAGGWVELPDGTRVGVDNAKTPVGGGISPKGRFHILPIAEDTFGGNYAFGCIATCGRGRVFEFSTMAHGGFLDLYLTKDENGCVGTNWHVTVDPDKDRPDVRIVKTFRDDVLDQSATISADALIHQIDNFEGFELFCGRLQVQYAKKVGPKSDCLSRANTYPNRIIASHNIEECERRELKSVPAAADVVTTPETEHLPRVGGPDRQWAF